MTLKLPRLTSKTPVTSSAYTSAPFQRFWDQFARSIETAFNGNASLSDQVSKLSGGVAFRDQDNEFTRNNTFDNPVESPQGYTVDNEQVVGARVGGWTAGTGTPNEGAYAAYGGQTMGSGYSQAAVQALDNAAKATAQRLLAIEQAMRTHGLIDG